MRDYCFRVPLDSTPFGDLDRCTHFLYHLPACLIHTTTITSHLFCPALVLLTASMKGARNDPDLAPLLRTPGATMSESDGSRKRAASIASTAESASPPRPPGVGTSSAAGTAVDSNSSSAAPTPPPSSKKKQKKGGRGASNAGNAPPYVPPVSRFVGRSKFDACDGVCSPPLWSHLKNRSASRRSCFVYVPGTWQ